MTGTTFGKTGHYFYQPLHRRYIALTKEKLDNKLPEIVHQITHHGTADNSKCNASSLWVSS